MKFAHPAYLWLLLILVPLIAWYIYKQRHDNPSLALSSLSPFKNANPSLRARSRHILFALRLGVVACLIVMLARPLLADNKKSVQTRTTVEGTDIVIALDLSTSMMARDFKPDRFGAAKRVAKSFIEGRPNDNIGLVIFAGESMRSIPLTSDHETVMSRIDELRLGMMEDGTAIGDGIGTAINAIKDGQAKSKSIILMTDGDNNAGLLTPRDAGLLAKEYGIKVYTIGIGTRGKADVPIPDQFGRTTLHKMDVIIDENILKDIAKETNAKYFRATDDKVLSDIFAEIDQLETTEMNVENFAHTEDDPGIWPWLALFLFLAELTLRYTVFRAGPQQ